MVPGGNINSIYKIAHRVGFGQVTMNQMGIILLRFKGPYLQIFNDKVFSFLLLHIVYLILYGV